MERELEEMILHNSTGFYLTDSRCPLSYEPSGFDFLSPCLQTADLMVQVSQHSEHSVSRIHVQCRCWLVVRSTGPGCSSSCRSCWTPSSHSSRAGWWTGPTGNW